MGVTKGTLYKLNKEKKGKIWQKHVPNQFLWHISKNTAPEGSQNLGLSWALVNLLKPLLGLRPRLGGLSHQPVERNS